MELKEKLAWLKQASNEELLDQLNSLTFTHYTAHDERAFNTEDINLTRNEILARMGGK